MGKYTAKITIEIDVFEAQDAFTAGDMANDYITALANMTESLPYYALAWADCNFAVFEEIEGGENVA
jgi:hypothetical protein